MGLQLQVFAWIAFVGHLCRAATIAPNDIFITEVVDPGDVYQARYVQLYAVGANQGDVVGGSDFHLKVSFNTNAYFSNEVLLSGVAFGPGGFLIVCRSASDFSTQFPSDSCDLEFGSVNSNGNDAYALVFGDDAGETIHDIFGTEFSSFTAWDKCCCDSCFIRRYTWSRRFIRIRSVFTYLS